MIFRDPKMNVQTILILRAPDEDVHLENSQNSCIQFRSLDNVSIKLQLISIQERPILKLFLCHLLDYLK